MSTEELLHTDFDGNYAPNPYEVIEAGIDDPRHRDRVPGLTEMLANDSIPETDRFLACYALTAWAEPAGYSAVIDAAGAGKEAPWYDTLIDRMYSVDNTFAHLAAAISDGEYLAKSKGTESRRREAVRALIDIADSEFFDGKLEYILDDDATAAVIEEIKAVVLRGARALTDGGNAGFDLASQLVDLAAAVAAVDGATAVDLATQVISVTPHYRALNHSVSIVYRAKGAEGQEFGEYLKTVGDEKIRKQVDEIIASR